MIQVEIKVNGKLIGIVEIVNKTAQEVEESNKAYYVYQNSTTHMAPSYGPSQGPKFNYTPTVCRHQVRFMNLSVHGPLEAKVVEIEHDTTKPYVELISNAFCKLRLPAETDDLEGKPYAPKS